MVFLTAVRDGVDAGVAYHGGDTEKYLGEVDGLHAPLHPREVVESLPNPHPARQHGDIGNETGIAHELFALRPGVSSEHPQLTLI